MGEEIDFRCSWDRILGIGKKKGTQDYSCVPLEN